MSTVNRRFMLAGIAAVPTVGTAHAATPDTVTELLEGVMSTAVLEAKSDFVSVRGPRLKSLCDHVDVEFAPAWWQRDGIAVTPMARATAAGTPILAHCRQWKAHRAACDLPATEEEAAAAYERMMEAEERLLGLPATGARDLAAKIMTVTSSFDFTIEGFGSDMLKAEIQRLLE